MTRKPVAGIAALFVSTTLVAACSVMDLSPVPYASIPEAPAQQVVYTMAPVQQAQPAQPAYAAAPAQTVYPAAPPASVAMAAPIPQPVPQPLPQPMIQPAQPVAVAAMSVPPATSFGFPKVPMPQATQPDTIMPAEEVQCRRELKRLGVSYRDLPRIRDSASCGIDWPVELTSLSRNIKLTPAAKLNCAMAVEAARWAQEDLAPAARTRYLSGVAEVKQMSSYSCRKIAGSRTMSEHSKGNAIDIGAVRLGNGRVISIASRNPFAFRQKSFLNRVRSEACDKFGTVLGPGYNEDHADHFHLDLKERRRAACH